MAAMETEHQAQPLSTPSFPGCLHDGASPLIPTWWKTTTLLHKKLKSIFPVLLRWIHRCHHIDRTTVNTTVLCTPPTRHLGGGCVRYAPPLWVFRGCFVPGLVDRGSWGADRGRKGPIASLSVARDTHAPPFLDGWWVCFSKTSPLFFDQIDWVLISLSVVNRVEGWLATQKKKENGILILGIHE